jgi:enolase-phosphatase E1
MTALAPRLYLLDIEGTVAPLSLTTGQLFPYARAHFTEFLRIHSADPAVQSDLTLLAEENGAETDPGCPTLDAPLFLRLGWENARTHSRHPERGSDTSRREVTEQVEGPAFLDPCLKYLLWLMDRDRKSTALKSLQGKIWKAGFESGDLKGTLFADVPAAFERWCARAKVAIYSSGSVEAQKLLFRHSIYADLTPLISGYFDTRTGPKFEPGSYSTIAAAMHVAPAQSIFFSDVVKELDAAREAGFATRLVVRQGNAAVADPHGHPAETSFEAI